jgi:site-specific recombinase XerD
MKAKPDTQASSEVLITKIQGHLIERDCSAATINGYSSDLRTFFGWFDQNCLGHELYDLDANDIEAFLKWSQRNGDGKINTVNRRVASLTAFSRWAYMAGVIGADLVGEFHGYPVEKVNVKSLSQEQQMDLIKAIEKDIRLSKIRFPKRWISRQRDASLVKFLLFTGLRLNEGLGLLMNDLHMFDRKGAVEVRNGTKGRERIVPLSNDARKAVLEWLAVRPDISNDYLWIAVENEEPATPLSGRSVQRLMRRIGQDACIDNLTPQLLRHTFAKNLADSGVKLEEVAALLGHTSLNSTKVYFTPSTEDLERAVGCKEG